MGKSLALLLAACVLLLAPAALAQDGSGAAPAQPGKILVMANMAPLNDVSGCWMNAIYAEAFRRLGYGMHYLSIPAARSGAMADRAEIDGEMGRTAHYGKHHSNLVRIEEPVFIEQMNAYTISLPEAPLDFGALRASGHVIAFLRGQPKLENDLASIPASRLYPVNNTLTGLRMLQAGRVDVFIGPRFRVEGYLDDAEFVGTKIHVAGELESEPIHGYLTHAHRKLARDLAPVLREMKAEGLIERYRIGCNDAF